MIKRAGMSLEEYIGIIETFWSTYWVIRRGDVIQFPLNTLKPFADSMEDDDFETIIFV